MTAKELPPRPNLEQYKKQAKDLLKQYEIGEPGALSRITKHHPEFRKASSTTQREKFQLADAQWVIAREHGFESWSKFASQIRSMAVGASQSTAVDRSASPVFAIDLAIKTQEVNRCEFTRDGKRVVMSAQGNPVGIWNAETGQRVITFEDRSVAAWAVAWSKDQRHIFLGTRDGTVEMRDSQTGLCVHTYSGSYGLTRCLDSTSDNNLLLSASGTRDPTVRLWDVQSERCLRIMEGHSDGVYEVAFEPSARRALSGSRDTTVRMWDLENGKCLQVFKGHSYHVHSVLWSTDQRRVLSCSQDIRLWDVETGRCLRVFESEPNVTIRRVAWSADQRTALSAAHDGTVRLWDVERGRCLRVFEHPVGLVSVKWSADERRAYSCDWNGTIRIWDVDK